jgi:ankyrin repeat protein
MAEEVLEEAKGKLYEMGIKDVDTYIEYVAGKVKVYDLKNIPELPLEVYHSIRCPTRNTTKNRKGSYGQFCKVNINGEDYGIKTQEIKKPEEKFDILLEIWTQVFLTCDPRYGKHIPEIHFVYKQHNEIYIVMKILKEDTLYSVIENSKKKYFWYEVPYLQKIVDILEHFDTLYKFRHRDLHVSNILIDEDVYIIDFGRACFSVNGYNFNVEKYGNGCTNSYDIPILLLSIASDIYVHIQNNDVIERSLINILLSTNCSREKTQLHHCVYDKHVKGNKTYMDILSKFNIKNVQECLNDDNNDKRKNNGYFISLDHENNRVMHLNKLEEGWTELHWASYMNEKKDIPELLRRGAEVNAKNKDGHTPLFIASKLGRLEVVKMLLGGGAVVDAAMNDGTTPLYIASQHNRLEVVKVLLEKGAAVDAARNIGASSLHIASQEGHLEVVRELLGRGAAVDAALSEGATPLFVASEKGHLEVVRELLARGAPVDAAMNDATTPLFIASQEGLLNVVKELLARGAAVNAARNDGLTPLLIASLKGRLEVVQELFKKGAKLPTDKTRLEVVLKALKDMAIKDKKFKADLYEIAKNLYRNKSTNNNPSKRNTIAAFAGMSYKNFETHKMRTNVIKYLGLSRKKVGGRHRTRKTSRHSPPILKTLFQLE